MTIKTTNQVITSVLTLMQPLINDTVANYKKRLIQDYNDKGIKYSEAGLAYWCELYELGLVYDLVKSLNKYTLDTDTVRELFSGRVSGGRLKVGGVITRDGKDYVLQTDVIAAGGYNIVRYHLRYITKTNLPKTGNTSVVDQVAAARKRMTKTQRIQSDIDLYERYIADSEKKVTELEAKTEPELWANHYAQKYTYNPENPNFTSEAHWAAWMADIRENAWVSHLNGIRSELQRIVMLNKTLSKLHDKLVEAAQ